MPAAPQRTIRFADDTWHRIRVAAEREGVSAAQLVREAVAAHLAALAERSQQAAVDAEVRGELTELRRRVEALERVTGARSSPRL